MYRYYNPNPVQTNGGVGDCSVRAVAKALNISWEKAFAELSASAFLMGDVISSNIVIMAVLRKYGFKKRNINESCEFCYTVEDFCREFPYGTYVVFSQDHVATVVDGILYDSWNSLGEKPLFYMEKYERND